MDVVVLVQLLVALLGNDVISLYVDPRMQYFWNDKLTMKSHDSIVSENDELGALQDQFGAWK
jgi:hypothetical protein